MFKKADPLVDSVKIVMEQNSIRRVVERLVNEEFGVTSRKGLPHELYADYDSMLKEATEAALSGPLNEVSKEKLGRYIKKANYDSGMADWRHGKLVGQDAKKHKVAKQTYANQSLKREKGIGKAVDKLTGKAKVLAKEETEAPKTAKINESFEHFLRNRFLKD